MIQTTTLKTIQMIAKIAKIVVTVLMVCCIVGSIGCFIGLWSVEGITNAIQFGHLTIHGITDLIDNVDIGKIQGAMLESAFSCAAGAVILGFAKKYLEHEMAAGTPFTFEGSKELLKLGIISAAVPIAADVTASIIGSIMESHWGEYSSSIDQGEAVLAGMVIVAFSFVVKYGAEIVAEKNKETIPAVED